MINNPDQLGVACDIVQHGVVLPSYFMDSCPNHPNYHLGPLLGSPCDTLGLGVAEKPPPLSIGVHPNPSAGSFTVTYPAQAVVGTLEVRDVAGRLVLEERLPQWSQVHTVELEGAAAGIYHATLAWGGKRSTTRIAITGP
ncbi:MAG: T9SS type A sorting domain-containing protein [Flavobacteriales bacterium]|nr:MAG: T9SS type A sorting domain-containing protein [Flavobacteriales bacterium]